ncbi:hypothetical protein TPY_3106 [Sulfobacillus acidophilus TPY]|uniref:Uncharacterized protein n=1 Tax=Sulfobacillus acidophilus (strain ATCC 700253 / DSM 10332 / NAL) TaxID=679936 RepID=G8U158_SULAD|nr:hypothetical protein TPY_3106 [Sulfobacillus acidophilus TPY]AEW04291.1 hypothetical protein Sulac_0788 [Sulfobacillus acidophilus DSM 10332]
MPAKKKALQTSAHLKKWSTANKPMLNARLQRAGDMIQEEFLEAFRRLADQ